MIVVFDASTVVGAALNPDGTPMRALSAAVAGATLALSKPILEEIREVLSRPKFRAGISLVRRATILSMLEEGSAWFEPTVSINDCIDPKDNKYLELALAAGASVIVSSDNHLLRMHPWRGIGIRRPAEYLLLS